MSTARSGRPPRCSSNPMPTIRPLAGCSRRRKTRSAARSARADSAGLQVVMHAIGERANALLLDIFDSVAKAHGPRDRRFRVEHAQHLRMAGGAPVRRAGGDRLDAADSHRRRRKLGREAARPPGDGQLHLPVPARCQGAAGVRLRLVCRSAGSDSRDLRRGDPPYPGRPEPRRLDPGTEDHRGGEPPGLHGQPMPTRSSPTAPGA